MAVKCPKCHADNPETLKFCGECGTQLIPLSKNVHPEVTETVQVPILATGSTFANRYQIIEELGKGGMGKVYKVFDQEVQAKMALKLIKPEVSDDNNVRNNCHAHGASVQPSSYIMSVKKRTPGGRAKAADEGKGVDRKTAAEIDKESRKKFGL